LRVSSLRNAINTAANVIEMKDKLIFSMIKSGKTVYNQTSKTHIHIH